MSRDLSQQVKLDIEYHNAVEQGDLAKVKEALQKGANVNSKIILGSEFSYNALGLAFKNAKKDFISVIKYLTTTYGLDWNSTGNGSLSSMMRNNTGSDDHKGAIKSLTGFYKETLEQTNNLKDSINSPNLIKAKAAIQAGADVNGNVTSIKVLELANQKLKSCRPHDKSYNIMSDIITEIQNRQKEQQQKVVEAEVKEGSWQKLFMQGVHSKGQEQAR